MQMCLPFSSPCPCVLCTPSTSPPPSPLRSLAHSPFPSQVKQGWALAGPGTHLPLPISPISINIVAPHNCSSPPKNPNPPSLVSASSFLIISPLEKRESILTHGVSSETPGPIVTLRSMFQRLPPFLTLSCWSGIGLWAQSAMLKALRTVCAC